MENTREYIESGILELYVLGVLSPEEKLQVEAFAADDTAVKAEIAAIEQTMEGYAEVHAIEPPEELQGRIMNSLITNLGDDRTFTKPRKHTDDEDTYEDDNVKRVEPGTIEVERGRVVEMPQRQTNFYKYAFAACLVLLLISIYGLFNLYSKLKDSDTQLTAMLGDREKIANQVILKDKELDIYRDPSFKILKLQGTAKTPKSAMTLAWNAATQKVVLDMRSLNLPDHDKQHQYQLWAIVAGKPVDLGVFDKAGEADTSGVKEMKNVANAELFAVTVEPTGGSVNPTLTEMVVAGASK